MTRHIPQQSTWVLALLIGLSTAWIACESSSHADASNALTHSAPTHRAEDVDVERFVALLATLNDPILLDVRSDEEWAEGHLPNASYIPFEAEDFEAQLQALDKNRSVLVYCAAGGRSSHAMGVLNQAGQAEVFNLLGGIRDWAADGQPVVHGDPHPIQSPN
ncbi:MAG: rhodanese-like domain-containing protein [Flavobacteriales bacterium]